MLAAIFSFCCFILVITGTSLLNADIVFIIDCSSTVPYRDYGIEKSFVRALTQYLNIQPGQSRAALVVYGSRAWTVIRLGGSQTFLRFDTVLTRAPYLGGDRRYDKALGIAKGIFENARENVPKVMLLFMAGKQVQVTGNVIKTCSISFIVFVVKSQLRFNSFWNVSQLRVESEK